MRIATRTCFLSFVVVRQHRSCRRVWVCILNLLEPHPIRLVLIRMIAVVRGQVSKITIAVAIHFSSCLTRTARRIASFMHWISLGSRAVNGFGWYCFREILSSQGKSSWGLLHFVGTVPEKISLFGEIMLGMDTSWFLSLIVSILVEDSAILITMVFKLEAELVSRVLASNPGRIRYDWPGDGNPDVHWGVGHRTFIPVSLSGWLVAIAFIGGDGGQWSGKCVSGNSWFRNTSRDARSVSSMLLNSAFFFRGDEPEITVRVVANRRESNRPWTPSENWTPETISTGMFALTFLDRILFRRVLKAEGFPSSSNSVPAFGW